MRDGQTMGEEPLLRLAMLWLTALAVVVAPVAYAGSPIEVSGALVAAHGLIVLMILVALWRRWITAPGAAGLVSISGWVTSLVVFWQVMDAVQAGAVGTEAAGNVILSSLVAVSGVAFIGLATRPALGLSVSHLVGFLLVIVATTGESAGTMFMERGVVQSLRFGVTAIALFLVATMLSGARARDRDAAKREQERLRARARELEMKEGMRRQLQQEAAHELKGPLAMVKGAAETLATRADRLTPEQAASMHEVLRHGVARLEERLTELGAEDVGGMAPPVLVLADAALRAALGAVATQLQPEVQDLSAAENCLVKLPPHALEHVLENLLSNAHKYADPGAPVTIEVRANSSSLAIEVVSRGGQLTSDDEDRVFERNYRGKKNDPEIEGAGVGLTLVRRLVTEWGGHVWCDVGHLTTTFGFTVPKVAATDQAVTLNA